MTSSVFLPFITANSTGRPRSLTSRSAAWKQAGCGGELALELLQALLVVAVHLTDGEQVATLGIEQEEQAVEEGERAAEEWFEQAIALPGGQPCWQLAGTLCIENEAAREMWENL